MPVIVQDCELFPSYYCLPFINSWLWFMKNISPIFGLQDRYDCIFQVQSQLGQAHVCSPALNAQSFARRIPVPKPQRWGRTNSTLTWGSFGRSGGRFEVKDGFSEPAGSLLPVCLLWCPVTAPGMAGHSSERQKSILCWVRKGDISEVGTGWLNISRGTFKAREECITRGFISCLFSGSFSFKLLSLLFPL